MEIAIQLPLTLRSYCRGAAQVTVFAGTVREALTQVERHHPELYVCVCDETGAIRQHVNVFVNDAFLRDRQGLDTKLEPGDVLTIMPAVSGG